MEYFYSSMNGFQATGKGSSSPKRIFSDQKLKVWNFFTGIRSGKNRIRDKHPVSYFREQFFEFKILKFFVNAVLQIWDPVPFLPRILDGKIRIRDKHPGSATMRSTDPLESASHPGRSKTMLRRFAPTHSNLSKVLFSAQQVFTV